MDLAAPTRLTPPRPGARPIEATWEAEDPHNSASPLTLVLRLPAQPRIAWTPAQRRLVAQVVGDSALHALYSMEQDGVKT